MNWIHPNFLQHQTIEGGQQVASVFLADDPDDCFFGSRIDARDTDGSCISFHFPEKCGELATALMTEGSRLELVNAFDVLPYEEVVATFERLGRKFIIGRSWQGHFYIHCKVNSEWGFLAAC